MIRASFFVAWTLVSLPTLAVAQQSREEPRGCDKFRWPIAAEQGVLRSPATASANGAEIALGRDGRALTLVPLDKAGLAMKPERMPREGTAAQAAFVRFPAPAKAETIQVTLTSAVWTDLVQDGRYLKPSAFSGALDCPGVRKIVRFRVEPKPYTLQLSGDRAETVDFVVDVVR